ncbi:hypothetical protein [Candidimonas nitroreducens]|uniref:Uncharacterized protein n=1 Tax=Candidimonas nitroreducens TaxID=683354 RepID=A0A225M4R9_9BURK|nr:hypothetical protein [Candidimonas nitroreducens]OWT55243.1 hypothetical protein CEY11_21270 [Candidimonas nitroreducens]
MTATSPIAHIVGQMLQAQRNAALSPPRKRKVVCGPMTRKLGPLVLAMRKRGMDTAAIAGELGLTCGAVVNHAYRYRRAKKEGLI